MRRRLLLFLPLIILGLGLYLLAWPVPIAPQAWTPPPAPSLTGPYQQNNLLAAIERLSLGEGFAPEDVAIDSHGRIYAGFNDGRIVRLEPDGTRPQTFANTGGRPLGMKFDSLKNLIVADGYRGLLLIDPSGSVSALTNQAGDIPLHCTNDLDIAGDGTIYFSDTSARFPIANYKADLLEHGRSGRLLAYHPATRMTRTVLGNLSYANGVAVSPDQTFILVVETGEYRIHRVWLNGPNAGRSEVFIENLPGFPDGISSNGRDKFWLALVAPRDQTLDKLLPRPFLRKVLMRLPKFLQPAAKSYSFVLGLSRDGQVIDNLQNGSSGCFAQISNVVEHNGALYFGSIGESAIGRYRLTGR